MSSLSYPIEAWEKLLWPFEPIKFINTTRSPAAWLASMYFQFMEIYYSKHGDFPKPEQYFDAQRFIYSKQPKSSVFYSYKAWSSVTRFSALVNCDSRQVKKIRYEDMIASDSITKFIEMEFNIKLPDNYASIDSSFKSSPWKDSKSENAKQQISKKLLMKYNVDPSLGFSELVRQIKRYLDVEFTDILGEMMSNQ